MKQILEAVSWPCRLLIILVLFFISTIFTSYSIYTSQQQKIEGLQNLRVKQDTKQDIRTFLKSLDPEILVKIDAHAKKVGIWLGSVNEVKLTLLSDRPEFDKFLSYEKTDNIWMIAGEGQGGDFIRPIGEKGTLYGHYLYPKNALIK